MPEPSDHDDLRLHLRRLLVFLLTGAVLMVGLALGLYRYFDAQRAETTRRIPVVRQTGPAGSVQYVPRYPVTEPPRR